MRTPPPGGGSPTTPERSTEGCPEASMTDSITGSPVDPWPGRDPFRPDLPQTTRMILTLKHKAQAILRSAGWDIAPPPVIWSPRMARCAGLFVVEKDARGKWHPEIRLSIPLLRRRDWPWPQQVCGMNCHDPEQVQQRILEHELIHYKLC